MALSEEDKAWLTADPSPLNPVPAPDEPGGASSMQPIPPAKTFDPFNQPSAPLLQRLGVALPMATAGFNPASMLGKMGLGAAVGAGSELMQGSSPGEAAKTGGIMAAVPPAGKFLRYLTSGIPGIGAAALWGKKTAGELADWFTKNVPEWKDIKNLAGNPVTGEKALFAMAKGEGPIKLGEAYDKALNAAKDLIPEGSTVALPEGIAKTLKLKISGGGSSAPDLSDPTTKALWELSKADPKLQATLAEGMGRGAGQVDARELLSKLPGTEGATRRAVREALGDYVPPDMLATYKKGMGLIDLADRGGERGFLAGEQYRPARAVQMVQEHGTEDLLRRGLQEPASMIRGPLAEPMSQPAPGFGSLPYYLTKGLGVLGSGALGYATHNPMLGVAAGGLSALYPKPVRNVPAVLPQAGPLAQQGLRAVMPGFLGNMRSSDEPQRIEMTMTPEGPGR